MAYIYFKYVLITFEFSHELSIRKKLYLFRWLYSFMCCTCVVYIHNIPLEIWMSLNAWMFINFKVKSKICLYKLKNVAWSPSSIEVLDKYRNYPLNTSHQLPQASVCSVIQHTWLRVLSPSQSVCMVILFHMYLLNLWTYFCKQRNFWMNLKSIHNECKKHLSVCLDLLDVQSQSANMQEIMCS